MRKWLALMLGCTGLLGSATASPAEDPPKRVFVIPVREEIAPPLVYVVRRGVKEAMEAKADLIVIDMDTPGGGLGAMMEIVKILANYKGETVTFVNTEAYSAGALICFATRKIYMAPPPSVIGAAAPVQMAPGGGTQDLPDTEEVKTASAISAYIRDIATANGYDKRLVDAMMKKTSELVIDGKTLNAKGQILTLGSAEASEEYGNPPRPLLSLGTVPSLTALLDKLGYAGAQVTTIKPTGAEKLGSWVNTLSPLLLIIGIIGIYIEFKTPGVVLPGVVAVVAFLLYFAGGYVAGLSGMEWVIVFVIGLALVISEFFVHPGTVLPGLAGLGLILVSLVMAMADVYPGTPALPTLPQIRLPIENLVIAMFTSIVVILILARILPRTPVYRTLVSQGASGVVSENARLQEQAVRLGQTGVAISNLRPGGKAQFGGEILDVITQGEMISKGRSVRIIGSSGTEAIVEVVA